MSDRRDPSTIVIGAGPAGLTAAYTLVRRGSPVVVLEKDRQVGGLARTVEYKGFRFDIGGHRFFTKVGSIQQLWRAMLGADLLVRPRLSRIYYAGKFFDYPVRAANALRGLGLIEALRVLVSYLWVQLRPIRPELTFEDWVSNRFGRRLYTIFFKTYTEKVWGISCRAIGSQWAAQRIKGLSLRTAIAHMLFGHWGRHRDQQIKTLIDQFEYPRLGPGMMWEAFRDQIEKDGGSIQMGVSVRRLIRDTDRIVAVEIERDGRTERVPVGAVLSTMPLRQLVMGLEPAAPPEVQAAATRLKYRDFLTVALIVDQADVFPDNWIYVHDPRVKVGRVQNFKNWSPDMVPEPRWTCLGLEYFCFEGDGLWNMPDRELVALARRELTLIGLVDAAKVVDGTVVRMPKAYPIYDEGYTEALDIVQRYLSTLANLRPAGRNGLHKYNNQDHSMVTAVLAVRSLLGASDDPWAVNSDDDYHEEDLDFGLSGLCDDLQELESTQPIQPAPPVRV